MKSFSKFAAMLAVAGALLTTPAAKADPFLFDPDNGFAPNGFSLAPVLVGSFDWQVGNALAQGGVTAVTNFLAGSGSFDFDLYYHARLVGLLSPSSVPIPVLGLNSTFEITVSVGITERVIAASVSTITGLASATFAVSPTPTVNFMRLYYDDNPATFANELTGLGFDDGVLIAEFDITSGLSTFTRALSVQDGIPGFTTDTTQVFDQFGANNYPGITTVAGPGGTPSFGGGNVLSATFVSQNGLWFVTPILDQTLNFSLKTPFQEVNPSASFANGAITPAIGPINGISGPDFQLQVDSNQSFRVAVIPEPATVLAGLVGVAGLGLARLARGRRKNG